MTVTDGLRLAPLAEEQLSTCVHCGFCLPACPTYREVGGEPDSPRGRIWLIRAAAMGELDPATADFRRHIDLCLDCRACESACPSGVRYGTILESARAAMFRAGPLWRLLMRRLWRPAWLARAARLLRAVQRLGLDRLAPDLAGMPVAVAAMAGALPAVRGQSARARLPARVEAVSRRRGRAAALLGCVQDAVFPEDNEAMVRLLAAGGLDVDLPPAQVCCGSLHQHAGDRQAAIEFARRNIAAFRSTEGPIVVLAAGCGATMKSYGRLLPGDPEAAAFAARVRDFSEVAAGLDLPPPKPAVPVRVTVHDACHLAHGQGVRRQPRELLGAIPGVELVEMEDADSCCGSAGLYNVFEWEMAAAVLERKIDSLARTGADWVVTSNPGCALQLRCGLRRAGLTMRVRGLSEVLAEAHASDAATAAGCVPPPDGPARSGGERPEEPVGADPAVGAGG